MRVFPTLTALENVQVGALLRHGRVAEARRRALDVLDGARPRLAGAPSGPRPHDRRAQAGRDRPGPRDRAARDPARRGDERVEPKEVADAVALVRRLRERGLTIVLVEHVLEVVMPLAETVIVLEQGRKIAEGSPQQLARDPAVIAAYLGPGSRRDERAARGAGTRRRLRRRPGAARRVAHGGRGAITVVVGANGAGKTTLLRAISGIVRPSTGSVQVNGTAVERRRAHDIVRLGIAHVPEGRRIFARLTVAENLRLGGYIVGDRQTFERTKARVVEALPDPP